MFGSFIFYYFQLIPLLIICRVEAARLEEKAILEQFSQKYKRQIIIKINKCEGLSKTENKPNCLASAVQPL